jgi:hypothetical protein
MYIYDKFPKFCEKHYMTDSQGADPVAVYFFVVLGGVICTFLIGMIWPFSYPPLMIYIIFRLIKWKINKAPKLQELYTNGPAEVVHQNQHAQQVNYWYADLPQKKETFFQSFKRKLTF